MTASEQYELNSRLYKADVVGWLHAEADSYRTDADKLAASGESGLVALVGEYRTMANTLRTAAQRFREHGPLPHLPLEWANRAQSHAARCPSWPEGCGEFARYEGTPGKSPAVVKHRDGCAVKTALEAEVRDGR
jgi:hypothetical protein